MQMLLIECFARIREEKIHCAMTRNARICDSISNSGRAIRFGEPTRSRRSPDPFFRLLESLASSSYIVVCLPRRMHRIITKLLTIPAAGVEPFYPFVSIAWSEESKMAVSDRGSASRQRSADEDEEVEGRLSRE